MTQPTQQDAINVTSGTAERVQALHNAGYGWMDPQAQTALASSPTSDQQMMASAGTYQSVFQKITSAPEQAAHAVGHFFDDPVLQKQPTAGLALQQYFLQRQGWAPIAQEDLAHIQQQLVTSGYLDKSEVNGVWTPASQQAYQQATSDHVSKQMKEGGGFSIGKVLSAFLPSHAIPALVGAARALPDEVRHLTADVAGSAANLFDPAEYGHPTQQQELSSPGAAVARFIEGDKAVRQGVAHPNQSLLNDINTVLTVLPIGKAATASKAAFGAASAQATAKIAGDQAIHDAAGVPFLRGMFTDLGAEAAQRGPGVISRAMYSYGAQSGEKMGLLNSRLLSQSPILKQMVAPVRALYDPQGKVVGGYYAFRTSLAQPYRLAGMQAVGSTVQQATLAGAAERGIAAVESPLDKHTALADQIYTQGTIGGPFGVALDMLSGALHGPLESGATRAAAAAGRHVLVGVNPSQTVGDIVQGVHAGVDAAQRPLNIGWAFHAGTKLGGNPMTVEDLTAKYGETFTQTFLNTKLNEFSAAEYADHTLESVQGLSSAERADQFRALSHAALNDPQLLTTWRENLLSRMDGLAVRFARDANSIHREARDAYRQGIGQFADVWPAATELFGNHARELVTPLTTHAIADAAKERAFSQAMGDEVGAEPGAYQGWLRQNNPQHEPGSFGLARRALPGQDAEVETQTERQARDAAKAFQGRH
jgi:hypothetical protein